MLDGVSQSGLGVTGKVKTVSVHVLLKSDLITAEESRSLREKLVHSRRITAAEILDLDLPAKNRVEALLRPEFLNDGWLRELACEFAGHTLHIFEEAAPGDRRPHQCLNDAFMLNAWGLGSLEGLQWTINEAGPALLRVRVREHPGALDACRAALLVGDGDAARMAREVAACAQAAAHAKERGERVSSVEPMVAREAEAAWQLALIIEVLLRGRGLGGFPGWIINARMPEL